MGRKGLKLAAAGALVIGITLVLLTSVPNSGVAFAQVMEKMASVQTLHARMTMQGGGTREIWAKRPNMLRINYDDGRYEISNGPILWDVDEKANKATKKPSYYYQQAQKLGVDVLDIQMDVRYFGGGDLTGFFSEGPVERVTRDGRAFDVYRMELEDWGSKVHFEALADVKTHLLESLRLDGTKEGSRQTFLEGRILAYDEPMPDDMFVFRPAEGMEVSDETVKGEEGEQLAPPEPAGASLSGRIVWASSGKPVVGADLLIRAKYETQPDGRLKAAFFERIQTDSDGRWRIEGVPDGRCSIDVRSWELDWPAEPLFAGNVGTPERPAILVDGPREYPGLDFRVYKPSDFYAHISIKVTDEDGNPVQGVGAYLSGDGLRHYNQGIDAGPGKQFTGPDGRFDAKDIWPYSEPVCVELYSYTEPLRYAAYVATSEPFVVEPKGQYRFEVVFPFARDLPLKVTDLEGNPLAWVGVSAYHAQAGRLKYVFPRYGVKPEGPTVTDGNGLVTVRGLAPNKKFVLILYRLPEGESDYSKAIASARTSVEVPAERQPGITQVAFDPRPIRIEGKVDVPPGAWGGVQLGLSDAETGSEFGLLGQKIGGDGQFVREGVPAGTVRVEVFFVGPDKKVVLDATGSITTEPGHAYVVQVVEDRVEVTRVEKIE